MNPADRRLERLLEAAQAARAPIPGPSPWFEQRVIQALKTEALPSSGFVDGGFIFRFLLGAAALAVVSVILPLVQLENPYTEIYDSAQTTVQLEKIP